MIKGGGSASLNGFFYQVLITIISSLTPAKDAESEWDTLCPEYKTLKDKADFAFKKNEEIIEVVQVKTSRTGKGFTPKNITNVIKDLVKDCSEAKKYTLKLITESTYSSSTLNFVSSINDKSYNNGTYLKNLINEKNIFIELKEATKPELMSNAKDLLKKYFIDTFEIENISDSKIELILNSHFVEIMLASINQNNLSRNDLNRKLYNQIFETPELKKLIFTSRNKVRKQLKQKPQFSDAEINEIKNYIPRNILKFENKRYSTEDFLVWAKDNSSTTNVKILNGPSGYGKSGLLRMLYVNLLYDNKYPFIPCYYNLSSTYNHGDFKSVFNAKPDQKYKSIPDSWVYFIFDGLDNLSIKSLENLADDISELVTKDINARAKIILAGRPDEYNKDLFGENEYEIAEIAPLTNDEKLQLFNKRIKDTSLDYEEQFINTRYNEDNLSIFDITAIIEFINSKKRFPSNKVDLYSFLLDKTITLLGRKQIANKEFNFASFLYITTGHKNPQYLLFDNRPQTSFLLSHKSIIEYSAACYIVNKYKTTNEIINLFCYEDIISPHMKNTLTMVLSILSEKDMPLFNQTLNTLLISEFKAPTLLSIEPILLPQSVKENIINFFTAPEMIRNTQMQCRNKFSFFISQSMKCFEYLINIFFKKDNISEKIILLDLIQNTMYYKQAFQQDTYKTFKPLLLNLINTQGDSEIILRIIDLFLSCNTVKQCFSTTEIDSLTEFVNSKNSLKTVCGMHLCKILSSCPENISDKSFSVLEDCYFKILNWMLSQKSYQSTIETSSSQLFYYLGKTYFTLNISRFSCFLERYLSSIKYVKRRLPHHLPDKLILSILLEFESYNTDLVSLLLKISKQESKITFHNSDTMLDIICKAKSKKSDLLLCNMLNTYIFEQKDTVQNIVFIQPAICRMFSSYETFTFFKEKLSEQAIQKICSSKYISPLYNTSMILNMGESIINELQDPLKKEIRTYIDKSSSSHEIEMQQNIKIKTSFHIAFHKNKLRSYIRNIDKTINENSTSLKGKEVRLETRNYIYNDNPFIYYVFSFLNCKSCEDFLKEFFDEYHDITLAYTVLTYMRDNDLKDSVLNSGERAMILKPTSSLITKLVKKHISEYELLTLMLILDQSWILDYIKESGKEKVLLQLAKWDAIYHYRVNIKSEPFSYLKKHFAHEYIEEFLVENFAKLIKIPQLTTRIEEYVLKNNVSAAILYDMNSELAQHISNNLGEETLSFIIEHDTIKAFRLSLSQFDQEKICQNIIIDNIEGKIRHTVAYSLLTAFESYKDISEVDKNIAAEIIENILKQNKISDETRIALLEDYISLKHDNDDINMQLADYILTNEQYIPTMFSRLTNKLYFSTQATLPTIARLHSLSYGKSGVSYFYIRDIVLNSYRAIANNIQQTNGDFKSLVNALKEQYGKTNDPSLMEILESIAQINVTKNIGKICIAYQSEAPI